MSAPAPEQKKEVIPAVPKARAPEELAKIVAKWPAVIARTDNTLKVLLKESKPSFRADDEEQALIVVIPQSPVARFHQDNPESIRQLKEAILDVTGLDAQIRIVPEKEAPAGVIPVTSEDIDRLIRENIHMEIESEE